MEQLDLFFTHKHSPLLPPSSSQIRYFKELRTNKIVQKESINKHNKMNKKFSQKWLQNTSISRYKLFNFFIFYDRKSKTKKEKIKNNKFIIIARFI